ncbi:hypothetical protein [Streptomyces mirabilis]|uniref:hypothetical protein n=1 Tax=Streptomyces mirabilis TaxID=68239 RepID=UPI0036C68141
MPVSFAPTGGVNVVVSPESGLCPVGWVGVVALGGSAIVTVPSESAAVIVRDAVAGLPVEDVVDGVAVREVLPVARVLGPAALAYVSREAFRPVEAGASTVEQLPASHPELRLLERAAGREDAGEAARTRSRRPCSWSESMVRWLPLPDTGPGRVGPHTSPC